MKKNTVKKLKITKKAVATLSKTEMNESKGGTRTSNLCTQTCNCSVGCTVPPPTRDNSSVCKCL